MLLLIGHDRQRCQQAREHGQDEVVGLEVCLGVACEDAWDWRCECEVAVDGNEACELATGPSRGVESP